MEPFEAAEKKCEVIIDGRHVNLRGFADSFWHDLVECCHAEIVSSIHNEYCDAYLLSESSLFVWSDRLLLITCGTTKLVNSILFLLDRLNEVSLKQLLFQRKNEYYSHLQHSSFSQDVEAIQQKVQGKSLLFGEEEGHYTQLFYLDRDYQAKAQDRTYEFLMYGICEEMVDQLISPEQSPQGIRALLLFDELVPDAVMDEHLFEPFGYSLNAIRGAEYCSVHITPQQESSYISVETNIDVRELISEYLRLFRPRSFDLVMSNPEDGERILMDIPERYQLIQQQQKWLHDGYLIHFVHHQEVHLERV